MSNKIGGDVLVFPQTALLGELHFLLIRQSRFWANNNIPLLLLLNGLHANILEGFYMAARYYHYYFLKVWVTQDSAILPWSQMSNFPVQDLD